MLGRIHDEKLLDNFLNNRAMQHFKDMLGGMTVDEFRSNGGSEELIDTAIELNLSWRRRVSATIKSLHVGE